MLAQEPHSLSKREVFTRPIRNRRVERSVAHHDRISRGDYRRSAPQTMNPFLTSLDQVAQTQ
jgi:hypothetical protein